MFLRMGISFVIVLFANPSLEFSDKTIAEFIVHLVETFIEFRFPVFEDEGDVFLFLVKNDFRERKVPTVTVVTNEGPREVHKVFGIEPGSVAFDVNEICKGIVQVGSVREFLFLKFVVKHFSEVRIREGLTDDGAHLVVGDAQHCRAGAFGKLY